MRRRALQKFDIQAFLSHINKCECIALIRSLIDSKVKMPEKTEENIREMMIRLVGIDISLCPKCKTGRMVKKNELPRLTFNTS